MNLQKNYYTHHTKKEKNTIFYVLGTGAGVPENCFSLSGVLRHKDQYLLVDAGGGLQILKQLKSAGIKAESIHDVFISHKHIDHLLGLIPFIRKILTAINLKEYEGNLNIYADTEIKQIVDYIIKSTFHDLFQELYKERVIFHCIKNGEEYDVIGYKMKIIDTYSIASVQFGFEITLENNKKMFYLGDVPCSPQNYEIIKNAEWVLHEVFSTSEKNKYTKLVSKMH